MKKWLPACFMILCLLACSEEKTERFLIDGFRFEMPLAASPEDLLGGNVRKIQLETTPESLVGNVNKIIKSGDEFYILSDDRRVLHFDGRGKYLSSLDKRGGGPEEYAMLSDFEVCKTDGETAIWLSDFDKLRKYVLTDGKWHFAEQTAFGFVVNKFKIMPGGYFLLLTGQNDESLTLADMTGKPVTHYLKKETPFLIFKPVQFIRHDSGLVFQLGASNDAILFDAGDHTFSRTKIVNGPFLSSAELLKMFEQSGYDYLGKLSRTQCIRGFRQTGGRIWVDYYHNGERFIAASRGDSWKKMKVGMDKDHVPPLATIGLSDTPDGFILIEYPREDDNLNITIYEYK
jgi:hypothetical protein